MPWKAAPEMTGINGKLSSACKTLQLSECAHRLSPVHAHWQVLGRDQKLKRFFSAPKVFMNFLAARDSCFPAIPIPAISKQRVEGIMPEDNKSIVRRVMEEVWNKHNVALADDVVAPSWTHDDPHTPDFGKGPEVFQKVVNFYLSAFPDLRFTTEDMIAEGDKVVTRYSATGTHRSEFNGIPPTNRSFTIKGTFIDRVTNGKLAGLQVSWDALGLLEQIGVVTVGRLRAA
jgi:steroid delta-isomerase-like uncharacterized protein